MKKILLILLTIITFILLIIQKDTNLFLAFFLLFIPLLSALFFIKKDGIEIVRFNILTIIFYIAISIIYYFVTYDFLSTIILLCLMFIYYLYNPKRNIQEKYLYANKVILTKKITIPPLLAKNYKKAGIEIINGNKKDNEDNLLASTSRELIKIYHEIELNRSKYENLVRSKKMHMITSYIIPLIVVFVFIFKIHNPLNRINLLLIYFLLSISNIFLSVSLPSEKDIMLRYPRKKGAGLFSKEEKLFIIVNVFSYIAAITIPYMFILYGTDKTSIINFVFMLSFIITNFVNIAYHLDDSPTLLNIIKLLQNKIIILIILTSAFIFVVIHQLYDKYYTFSAANYIRVIIIILIMICWEDVIKLARFIKSRKKGK